MMNEQHVEVIVMSNYKCICNTCFSTNIICDSIERVIHINFQYRLFSNISIFEMIVDIKRENTIVLIFIETNVI